MDTIEIDALDQADMERLISGHDAAFNDLMERHATQIFQFLCRMVGNEDDANDLAQETFARVFRSCKSFRTNQKFSTWLYTIAANLAKNHFRWRARHPEISIDGKSDGTEQNLSEVLPSNNPMPNEQAVATERAQAVRLAVTTLPEDFREAIVLCEWEEYSIAEAAKILDATPKAIESRLYRGRQMLRKQLMSWL